MSQTCRWSLLGYVVLAPLVAPVLGVGSPHLYRWQMFRTTGTGIFEVEFRSHPSNRSPPHELPGLSSDASAWATRSMPGKAVARHPVYRSLTEVYADADRLCARLAAQGPGTPSVFVHARLATLRGWDRVADASFDLCRTPPFGWCGESVLHAQPANTMAARAPDPAPAVRSGATKAR